MSDNNLKSAVESLLFISSKPFSFKKLASLTKASLSEIKTVAEELKNDYNQGERGIKILENNGSLQMVSSPESAKIVHEFLKDETTGELTQPALETLTIIAYRGPINKYDLEQIRGVNCSLILRNLMIKGLVETNAKDTNSFPLYNITFDFLRFLGVNKVEELPDYEKLHHDENLTRLLENTPQV